NRRHRAVIWSGRESAAGAKGSWGISALKERSLERTDDIARGTPSPHGLRGDRSLVSRRSCGYPSSSSQCTEICWEASTEISFIGRTVTNARLQNTLATPTAIPTDTVTRRTNSAVVGATMFKARPFRRGIDAPESTTAPTSDWRLPPER